MAAPKPTLDVSQIKNLAHPMFILAFCHLGLNLKVTGILKKRLHLLTWPSALWGLNQHPSDTHAVPCPLTYFPQLEDCRPQVYEDGPNARLSQKFLVCEMLEFD